MIGDKLRINRTGLVVLDLAATYVALFLAYYLRFNVEVFPITKGIPPFAPYLALFPIITLIWPVVFYFRGLLQGRPQRSRVEEAFSVIIAVAVATLVLNAGLAFYRDFTYSRLVLGIFALLDVAFVVTGRVVVWSVMARVWASPVPESLDGWWPRSSPSTASWGSMWWVSSTTTPAGQTRSSRACWFWERRISSGRWFSNTELTSCTWRCRSAPSTRPSAC
jgi:hypothetical protein